MIFDSHAHYDDSAFDEDREILLSSMPVHGIDVVVNASSSMETSRASVRLAEEHDFIYAAVGVHPDEVGELNEDALAELFEMSSHPKVVAIGEIGLDYYWDKADREIQKKWFRRQLSIAEEMKLPVIIHSRDAAADTMMVLKEENAERLSGIMHCFSYSTEIAEKVLKMGWYLGIGGVVTFKNAKKLKEVVRILPKDRVLLETDCPYLAPEPFRGKRNSSLNLPYVSAAIGEIWGMSSEEVQEITYQNAKRFYLGRSTISD